MFIEQLYTNCLSQAAYYVECNGEAIVIDPLRDYEIYIQKANERGAKIKYIFETHFHADFVSGHIDLAKASGAAIIYGPNAETGYNATIAEDGQEFGLGDCKIKVLHTPGHTPESSCFLLIDNTGKDYCLFTGDTLFIGDVGRPDLCVADAEYTTEKMASLLYHSLNEKLGPLSDDVIIYPAHGPGSACGKNLGPETFSTLGVQRKTNYAMQPQSELDFVRNLLDGIIQAPSYFFEDASLNKNGYDSLDEIKKNSNQKLTPAQVQDYINQGYLVLDSRNPDNFELGFIPGSMNIGLNGQYAIWAATLLELDRKMVLVCEPGTEQESATRLARVGFNNIAGHLDGGFESWLNDGKQIDMIISITAEELALDYNHSEISVLDVRKESEWDNGHLPKAQLLPLDSLMENTDNLDPKVPYYIHCAGGYRSMIAASLLKARGFNLIKNIYGGFAKIKEENVPVETASKKVTA